MDIFKANQASDGPRQDQVGQKLRIPDSNNKRTSDMKPTHWMKAFASIAVAVLVLAGCANQMEPAKKAIADIEAAVAAAGEDATKYIPDEVSAVQDKVANLKAQFDKKDYKGVLAAAPAILAEAQGLAANAATKKGEAMDALNGEWNGLAASLPQALAAIQSRVDMLSKSKKLPAGVDKTRSSRQRRGRRGQ
jgi:outer membrane murein-binding lipoprotein Lpp